MSYARSQLRGYDAGTMGAVQPLSTLDPSRGVDYGTWTPEARAIISTNPIPGTGGAQLTTTIGGSRNGVPYTAQVLNVQGVEAALEAAIQRTDAPNIPLINDWLSFNNQVFALTGRYPGANHILNQFVIYGVQNPNFRAAFLKVSPGAAGTFSAVAGKSYIPGQGWINPDQESQFQDLGPSVEPTTYVAKKETRTTPPPETPPPPAVPPPPVKKTPATTTPNGGSSGQSSTTPTFQTEPRTESTSGGVPGPTGSGGGAPPELPELPAGTRKFPWGPASVAVALLALLRGRR